MSGLAAELAGLAARYRGLARAERDAMTERETAAAFVLPLLRALGWDTKGDGGVRERSGGARGPVVHELLADDGMPLIVVETRRMSDSLDGRSEERGRSVAHPERAVRRAWSLGADWAVLTNFAEVRLYHALSRRPEDGLVFSASVADMASGPGDLALLARESVLAGGLDGLDMPGDRGAAAMQVIDDLGGLRRDVCADILRNNAGIAAGDGDGLQAMAQELVDRLLVVRIAEDRGLVGAGALRCEVDEWRRLGLGTPLARRIRALFEDFGEAYGAAPFEAGPIDAVSLSDGLLAGAVELLYGYDFALLDSDVLGGAYEDYLASPSGGARRGRPRAAGGGGGGEGGRRKRLGAFYTPPRLVSHTLDMTLGRRLAECRTPDDVSKIRVLDPACGSGSFLIKAFDLLLDWYREYNRAASKKAAAAARGAAGKRPGGGSGGRGTLDVDIAGVADPEDRILRDNLFGIDIDPRAAAIASTNLLLRAASKNKRPAGILGANILVGNSLVTGLEEGFKGLDAADRAALNPLDPARLPHRRFDVVVGNPPYYGVGGGDPIRVSASFGAAGSGSGGSAVNAAMMFVERAVGLLRGDGGRLGLVIPKACSYAKGWSGTRRLLSGQVRLTHVVDCAEAFRGVSLEQVVVVGERRGSPAGRGGGGGTCRIQRAAGGGAVRDGGEVGLYEFAGADMIFLESDPASWSIRKKMLAAGVKLGDLVGDGAIMTGEYAQGLGCWLAGRPEGGRRMLAGGDIARYRIAASRYYRRDEPLMAARGRRGASRADAVRAPHVVGQRIVAHMGSPRPHIALAFAYDEEGSRAFDTVTHVLPGGKIDAHALVAVLNSRPVSWHAHKFVFCNAVRSMDLRPWYMKKIVVPAVGPGDERELARLGRAIAGLALSGSAKRPRMGDYLAKNGQGALELREYVRAAGGSGRKMHGGGAEGRASRVEVVDAGGGWLDFFARYSPPRMRAPRRGRVLSLRVPDRGMRDFVRAHAGGARRGGRGGRAGPLYEQVAGARLPAYGSGFAEHARALRSMLAPYARAMARFEAWRKEYAALDAAVDRVVCRAFGLSRDDARRIAESSRPPGWSNY